jgi:uncharacterized protein (DUF58 family)
MTSMGKAHAALARERQWIPSGSTIAADGLVAAARHAQLLEPLVRRDSANNGGPHQFTARGHGMDYAESRLYSPGDEVRHMDWRETARTGKPHTKLFQVERSADLMCVIDLRATMRFGTRLAFKHVVAAELAAAASWSVGAAGDRAGALLLRSGMTRISPTSGSEGALEICAALASEDEDGLAQMAPLEDVVP